MMSEWFIMIEIAINLAMDMCECVFAIKVKRKQPIERKL